MHREGIVCAASFFKERHRIVTLFTPEGLIKCVLKPGGKKDRERAALATPLTRGEYVIQEGKGDLYTLIEGKTLDYYLPLRQSLALLQQATAMLRALLYTQWPDKPAPLLYALLVHFLEALPSTPQLHIPFLIKLLKHEGILPAMPPTLTPQEACLVAAIAKARTLQELPSLSDTLSAKIEVLFDNLIQR